MVRIKIAYKDSTKIPKKRLYVIQFKVEEEPGVGQDTGVDEGGDDEEPSNEDDTGMEEVQHDPVPNHGKAGIKEQLSSGSTTPQQGISGSNSAPSSSKRCATWASLFKTVKISA
jgi:hypothetical protein